MIKKYPQRIVQQDAQGIVLHLNIPRLDLPAIDEMGFFQGVCQHALSAQGWIPQDTPKLSVVRRSDSHLVLACAFTPLPPVRLPATLSVTIEAPPMQTPQPEALMAELEALQVRWGKTTAVNRTIQTGDMVCIDAVGLCEGELVPLSIQQGFWLSIQDKNGPLATGLRGAQVGEQRRIAYALPEDYPTAHWRGAAAVYVVRVREVQALQVPVVSDLARLCDLPGVHNEETLFAALHEIQREALHVQWHTHLRQRILDTLLKETILKVPTAWIEEQLTALWAESDGRKRDAILSTLALEPAEQAALKNGFSSWQKHPHLSAKVHQDLAYQLLLQAVVHQQKLALSDAHIEAALERSGQPLNLSSDQVWQQLVQAQSAQQFLNQLTLDLAERYLVKQAQIRHGETLLQSA